MNHKQSSKGFSLVELMVAMVLGLVVVGGAASVLLSSQQSYRSGAALSDVQESSRIAFELLARDLRQAGLAGCGAPGRVANVLNKPSDNWYTDFRQMLRGYESELGGAAGLPQPTNFIANTDSIEIKGVESASLSVSQHDVVTGRVTTNQSMAGVIEAGDIVVVCNPEQAAISQVTKIVNTTETEHAAGGGSPGNCNLDWTYYSTEADGANCANDCSAAGNTNAFICRPFHITSEGLPGNALISRVKSSFWYVGENPRGGRSLYRQALVNSAGAAAVQAQEMVRNINDLQVEYQHDANPDPLVVDWVYESADQVLDWDTVRAVSVSMVLEAQDETAGTDGGVISRQFNTAVGLRNRLD